MMQTACLYAERLGELGEADNFGVLAVRNRGGELLTHHLLQLHPSALQDLHNHFRQYAENTAAGNSQYMMQEQFCLKQSVRRRQSSDVFPVSEYYVSVTTGYSQSPGLTR